MNKTNNNKFLRITSGIRYKYNNSKELEDTIHMDFDNSFGKNSNKDSVLANLITDIGFEKVGQLKEMAMEFEYVDKKDFGFGDGSMVAEITIPFVLNLPNNTILKLNINNKNYSVSLNKMWTDNATADDQKSSQADWFHKEKTIFFGKVNIISPVIPQRFNEGWDENIKGNNSVKKNDSTGYFRYTVMLIKWNMDNTSDIDFKDENDIKKIDKELLDVVNKIIDVYRFETKEYFVQRLSRINISTLYIEELNKGFNILNLNTESAVMNYSEKSQDKIKNDLLEAISPNEYDLLIMDSKIFLERNAIVLSVVVLYQALDIFLENELYSIYKNSGKTDIQIDKLLTENYNWKTDIRIKTLSKLKKSNFPATSEFKDWKDLYEKRSALIHKNKEIQKDDVKKMISSNIKIINILN